MTTTNKKSVKSSAAKEEHSTKKSTGNHEREQHRKKSATTPTTSLLGTNARCFLFSLNISKHLQHSPNICSSLIILHNHLLLCICPSGNFLDLTLFITSIF
ncbi:hypothetical protein QVD17_19396 [Tagetes erecta]|uniref:Uncharacterized protein n=1 Tax=Tagetes erecta TaxID=13708 RepID=A0AAD8NX74_TARER|nr:hypothetical protein QVD17_19396 [Tagetes erecta]